MGRKGRLSYAEKEKPIDPAMKAVADEWMSTIGREYEEIKDACRINAHKKGMEWSEDVFHSSIESCYSSICRNSLKDTSSQGCRNYLFRAYCTNIIHEKVLPYNAKKDAESEEFLRTYDRIDDNEADTKYKEQLYKDFATLRILEIVEQNFDSVSFFCFRLRFLMPKMSYTNLVKITKIKNAKTRVKTIIQWLQENVKEAELREEFENKYNND